MAGEEILVNYEELKKIIDLFSMEAEKSEQLISILTRKVEELHNSGFVGKASDTFHGEMESLVFPGLKRLEKSMWFGQNSLREIAQIFQLAEEEATNLIKNQNNSKFGEVLGASTGNFSLDGSMNKSWGDLFKAKSEISHELSELYQKMQFEISNHQNISKEIAGIDREIRELENQINLLSKLKPADGELKLGWDDGVFDAPWRTKADELEDQIENLNKKREILVSQLANSDSSINSMKLQKQNLEHYQSAVQKGIEQKINPLGLSEHQFSEEFSKTVPAKDSSNVFPRGNGTRKSNCTWYAAEAVKIASNGKIDIYPTINGDASQWLTQAQKLPEDVFAGSDKIPRAGDVLTFGEKNHVAFVEKAVLTEDGTAWEVTYSEEHYAYTYSKYNNTTSKIDLPEDPTVYRTQRTESFKINPLSPPDISASYHFIHFNY